MSSPSQRLPTEDPTSIVVFDRSRIDTLEHCYRERYYRYHWQGVGLERVTLSLDLEVGKCTHQILEEVLGMLKRHAFSEEALGESINHHVGDFSRNLHERGIAFELAAGYEQDSEGNIQVQEPPLDFIIQLYSCWMRNSVQAWCSLKAPQLLSEYAIVNTEQEEQLYLADGRLMFLTRADSVLRRHSDGELFVLNFKTVGSANDWWREQWRHDMQTLTEVLPIEARLGRRLSGVVIEGLVKGSKKVEYPRDSGQWWINSPLCWCWVKEAAPPFPPEYAAKYSWTDPDTGYERRLGKGFRRVPVWEDAIGVDGWLRWLFEHEPELLANQFVTLPPILRADAECEQWVRQNATRELELHSKAEVVNNINNPESQLAALDAFFPMSTSGGNCIRPSKCSCYDLCWGTAAQGPLENGYGLRIPNHPKEAEVLEPLWSRYGRG